MAKKTIAQQVEEKYADKIKATDSHTLLHLLRQERPDGTPFEMKEYGGKRVVEAAQRLAERELRNRGHELPLMSCFFLVCYH